MLEAEQKAREVEEANERIAQLEPASAAAQQGNISGLSSEQGQSGQPVLTSPATGRQLHDGAANTVLALTRLPARQRRVLSAKLREVLQDTSIDQGRKAEIASGFIKELRAEARASEET